MSAQFYMDINIRNYTTFKIESWSSVFPQSCQARPTDVKWWSRNTRDLHHTSAPSCGKPDLFHGFPWPWRTLSSQLLNICTISCAYTKFPCELDCASTAPAFRGSNIAFGRCALHPMAVTWRASGKLEIFLLRAPGQVQPNSLPRNKEHRIPINRNRMRLRS